MFNRTRKVLFLDRDGVINVDHGYVYRQEDFEFVPGIFDLCRTAQRKGYEIIIVTNQSGIARAYYKPEDFKRLMRWVRGRFFAEGIRLRQIKYCPHHPKQTGPFGLNCTCRKPRPGMIFKARSQSMVNLSQSIMIGDNLSDILCARRAGISKAALLKDGPTKFPGLKLEAKVKTPYYRAYSLSAIKALL